MATVIAGQPITVTRDDVERVAARVEPEPLDVWYVVVGGRRYPPKQVVEAATGLDRADFNSHQARSVLTKLGFTVARRALAPRTAAAASAAHCPTGAEVLEPYVGRWVAQVGDEILYDDDSPHKIVEWLYRHNRKAVVWKVPSSPAEVGSTNVVAL